MKKVIPKSQREISLSLQEPLDIVNPNLIDVKSRANDISFKGSNVKPFSLGFEDIDNAILYYFNEVIKPQVKQNNETIKVPIIYGGSEKWNSYQKDGVMRDNKGKIMCPIISFTRISIEKERSIGNKMDANNPRNYGFAKNNYNEKNRYGNFDLLNRSPVNTYYATVIPDYVTIKYDFIMFTYKVKQMNKLIEAVNYAADSYWGDPEKFKFITRIDSFSTPTEISDSDERTIKSEFSLTVKGHIIPDIIQKDLNSIKRINSAKIQLNFTTEKTYNKNDFII